MTPDGGRLRKRANVSKQAEWLEAVRDHLRLLILLHDREPDGDVLEGLRNAGLPELFALPDLPAADADSLEYQEIERGLALMAEALATPVDEAGISALAAEYAHVYLIHTYRASPCESVWFDEDLLERQATTFMMKDWIKRCGLQLAEGESRPEDHLVNELRLLLHLLGGKQDDGLAAAARVLDFHLLTWVPLFAERVVMLCQSPFFAGLALLTAGCLRRCRRHLEQQMKLPLANTDDVTAHNASKRRVSCATKGED